MRPDEGEDLDVRRNRMLGDAPRLSRRTQILIAAAVLIAVDDDDVGFVLMPSPPPVHQPSASTAVAQLGPLASPGAAT